MPCRYDVCKINIKSKCHTRYLNSLHFGFWHVGILAFGAVQLNLHIEEFKTSGSCN